MKTITNIKIFLSVIVLAVFSSCSDALLPEFYTADVKLSITKTDDGPRYDVSVSKPMQLEMSEVHVVELLDKNYFSDFDDKFVNDYNCGTSLTYQGSSSQYYLGDKINAYAYVVTPNGKFRGPEVTYAQTGEAPVIDSTKFVFDNDASRTGTLYIYGSGFPKETQRIRMSSGTSDFVTGGEYYIKSDGSTITCGNCWTGSYGEKIVNIDCVGYNLSTAVNIAGPHIVSVSPEEPSYGDFIRVTMDGIDEKSNFSSSWATTYVGREGNDLIFLYQTSNVSADQQMDFTLYDSNRDGMKCGDFTLTFKAHPWTSYVRNSDCIAYCGLEKVGSKAYVIGENMMIQEFSLSSRKFVTLNSGSGSWRLVASTTDASRYIYAAFYNYDIGNTYVYRYDVQNAQWKSLNFSNGYRSKMWMDGSKLRVFTTEDKIYTYDTSSGSFQNGSISSSFADFSVTRIFGSDGKYVYLASESWESYHSGNSGSTEIKRYPVGNPSSLSTIGKIPVRVDGGKIIDGKLYFIHYVGNGYSGETSYIYSVPLDDLSKTLPDMTNEGAIKDLGDHSVYSIYGLIKIDNHLLYLSTEGDEKNYLWVK